MSFDSALNEFLNEIIQLLLAIVSPVKLKQFASVSSHNLRQPGKSGFSLGMMAT
jgi:hypothetical protein